MSEKYLADAENTFIARAVTPDFCKVGKAIVAFQPLQKLKPQEIDYAVSVFARGAKVLMVQSINDGVLNNAGKGLWSGVSLKLGHNKILPTGASVVIEDRAAARDGDPDTPGLWLSERCRFGLETLPLLPRDDVRMEDVDTTANDHFADAVRYLVNSDLRIVTYGRTFGHY